MKFCKHYFLVLREGLWTYHENILNKGYEHNVLIVLNYTPLVKIQYCGEPPWQRGSVLDLKPPGISSLVSGGQFHLIHLTILALLRFLETL